MLAIILVAIGSVGAATGLTLFGIADSMLGDHELLRNVSIILMVGGVIITVLGGLWYRANERAANLEYQNSRKLDSLL